MTPPRSQGTTTWFRLRRGISSETLDTFGIYDDDRSRVHYPYPNAVKIRPDINERMRFWEPGLGKGQIDLFGPDQPGKRTYFLVEGESDAMRLYQELAEADKLEDTGVYGLSGVNTWRPENLARFGDAKTVYVVLDNDDPYENPSAVQSVEGAWPAIRRDIGRRAIRIKLPPGPKDLCEYFGVYNFEAFKVLCKNTPRASWHFKALDFTQPAPPRDWMMRDVFHDKSFNMVVGDPGMGKSWLTMGLSVALVEGWSHFMGRSVRHHGPVLYIDEENPEGVVRSRMEQLGLTPKGLSSMRYLHNQGLDFEENWTQIQDEVWNLEPTAVFIDSLSEVTSAEENSKTEMKEILARIKSLSRDLDTTVVLIHHSDKDKGRARGSGHIRAATDAEWWVGESEHDDSLMRLVCKKHRYGIPRGTTHMFRIEDEMEGQTLRTILRPVGNEEPF